MITILRRAGIVITSLVAVSASLVATATPPATAATVTCGVRASGAAPQAEEAVRQGCGLVGIPYQYGAGHAATPGPTNGHIDCSGLARYAYYRAAGYDVLGSGSTRDEWARAVASGWPIIRTWSQLLPGDLIYRSDSPDPLDIYHVAIYLGNNAVVEAWAGAVRSETFTQPADFLGAVRVFNPPTTTQGGMFHNIRAAGGAWQGFQALNGYQTDLPGDAKDVAIAGMSNGDAQVLIVGLDGLIYHRIRYANGTWSPFGQVQGIGGGAAGGSRVAIAGMPNGDAHIVILGNDNQVYHNIRYANGTWQGFHVLDGIGSSAAKGKDVAIAGTPDGQVQVVIVGEDDGIYHRVRYTDGNWSGFQQVQGNGSPAKGSRVAVTGMPNNDLQLVILGNSNQVYHNIRYANGNWQGFGLLDGIGSSVAKGKDVTIAGGTRDGRSQVVIVGEDDGIYHRVRNTDGTWSGFQQVQGIGSPAKGSAVAMAGIPDASNSVQLLIVGR